MVHPLIGWTIGQLLVHLNGPVTYVAITGVPGVGKTWLVEQLSRDGYVQWVRQEGDPGQWGDPGASPLERERGAGWPGRGGPSGHAWETELQWLSVRQRLLAAQRPEWQAGGRAWASDFWFDQSLAYAAVRLSEDQQTEYRKRWEEARQHIVQPKLTVLLDAAADAVAQRLGPDVGAHQEPSVQWEAIGTRIRGLVERPGLGPTLVLPAGAPEQALEEVAAAIAAMR